MAIFDVPQRFSQKWVHDKVPTMDSTEFHAMFPRSGDEGLGRGRVAPARADVGRGERPVRRVTWLTVPMIRAVLRSS